MAQPARLVTPQGKTIELPPDVYRQVKRLLVSRSRRRSPARLTATIQATYGKYAGEPSLTQALLAEHAAERARDEARLKRLRG
jgi:hypothetical protein